MNKFLLTIISAIALTLSVPAFADTTIDEKGPGSVINGDIGGGGSATATSNNVNANANFNGASSNVNVNVSTGEEGSSSRSISTRSTESVQYSGEYSVKNVPVVAAPALTTTLTETCMGSTSAGAGWVGFGISFGTTWRDTACVRRLDARQLSALGYNLAAKELMCDSDAVRNALKRAGKPCYDDLPEEALEVVNEE